MKVSIGPSLGILLRFHSVTIINVIAQTMYLGVKLATANPILAARLVRKVGIQNIPQPATSSNNQGDCISFLSAHR